MPRHATHAIELLRRDRPRSTALLEFSISLSISRRFGLSLS
ncbi:hypothetical protein C7S16_5659 [Burkholderia thailandensis]|uniref:Uncharacterized protein n=1 Tax=Burkholderia thailandensis TaxID=57975 RepID=A0AAW9CT05_BURTH|nr:hypothetical protein [Burkholderia thailandensis]MDW9250901.1 hypothetical protein [Burkholderia thailandensis]